MFKVKMEWELTNGQKYESWTIPWEIAQAEKDTGQTLFSVIKNEQPPTLDQQFRLCYQMQKRLDDKPVGTFENWRQNVVHIFARDFEATNFTQPEVSTDI
jgi:mRNA deadenylase 3'-5' endonuclease subunit Ccr4